MEYIEELEKGKMIIETNYEIKTFNSIMEELESLCQSTLDCKLVGNPEGLLSYVKDIYNHWECIKDKIHFIAVFFGEYKYDYIDLIIEQKVKLLNSVKTMFECEEKVGEYIGILCQSFFEGYKEYDITGSLHSLCWWQVKYCEMYQCIRSISDELYFELDALYFTIHDLQKIVNNLNSCKSLQNMSEP